MAVKSSLSPVKLGTYLVLSLVLLGLNQLGWLDWLKRGVEPVVTPVKQSLIKVRGNFLIWQAGDYGPSRLFLEEQINTLKAETVSQKAQIEKLKSENEQMRQLLGAPLPPDWQFLPAQVIGRQDQILVVDQGTDQQVAMGDVVVVEEVLVGQVIAVSPQESRVQLVFHPDFKTAALVRKSNLSGRAVVHGGRLFLEEVEVGKGLQPGSLVVTQKEGLVLGEVGKIVSSDQESTQRAEVVWPLEVDSLQTVFVVKK